MLTDPLIIILKFGLAALCGAIIGLEREAHGRSAGLRTNILVASGTTLMMMVSQYIFEIYQGYSTYSVLRIDPGRIASYAVSGMGFIGAGVVLKGRGSVRGLTTASCLWMVTGIGLAIGSGFYLPAVAATILSILTLLLFDYLKKFVNRNLYTEMVLKSVDRKGQIDEVRAIITKHKARILFVGFSRDLAEKNVTYYIHVRMREKVNWEKLSEELSELPGLKEIHWREGYVP